MSTVLTDKNGVKARKLHVCIFCKEDIAAGSLYDYRTGTDSGDFWEMHMHPECNEYAHETLSFEDYEDLSDKSFNRPEPTAAQPAPCPDCTAAMAKYDRLDARMAKAGNFGVVPLPRSCEAHRPITQ